MSEKIKERVDEKVELVKAKMDSKEKERKQTFAKKLI